MNCRLIALIALVAIPAGRPAPASGDARWFDLGHRVIARIAESRLTPPAAEAVREILGGQSLADASRWADDIRGRRRDTGPLHHVNIPLEATTYDPEGYCPDRRCIIGAIEADRRILTDATASAINRAEALRFLIHFVGDLHQPLHVSNNEDKGGNDTQVQFGGRGTNLHKVWDGELIQVKWTDEQPYLDHLMQRMSKLDLAAFERGTVVDWAMEGHRIAVAHAYQIPRHRHLGQAYVEENLPIVDLAIIKAGVRLARVLNDALAGYQPGPAAPALGPGMYSDHEAAAHAGEVATVVGTVVTVHRTDSGNLYLNFGADYPHQTFSGAVLNPQGPALPNLDGLVGKRVGIKGLIKLYKGAGGDCDRKGGADHGDGIAGRMIASRPVSPDRTTPYYYGWSQFSG